MQFKQKTQTKFPQTEYTKQNQWSEPNRVCFKSAADEENQLITKDANVSKYTIMTAQAFLQTNTNNNQHKIRAVSQKTSTRNYEKMTPNNSN